MSCGTNSCGCKGGGGMVLPFLILGAAVAVLVGALYSDIKGNAVALDAQLAATKGQLATIKAQLDGQQGQQLVAAKNHFYALYSDLIELAKTDAEAAAIIKRYGISMAQQQPAGR
jgi:hypothetical protein